MTDDEYRSIHAINYSALRVGRTSLPRMHQIVTGTAPAEESAALATGTLLHDAMQHGDGWADRYAVRPDGIDRRTKAGKEAYAAWLATLPTDAKILESASDVAAVEAVDVMRRSIMSHPLARALATCTGESEVQIVDGGRKCRIDKIFISNGEPTMLIDWKSTIDASPAGFARSAAKYGYHQQAAWYVALAERRYGKRLPFVFVAVESSSPHSVGVYQLVPDQLEAATIINEGIVKAYREWVEAGAKMHHTGENVETLTLPEWACKITMPGQAASVGVADDSVPF